MRNVVVTGLGFASCLGLNQSEVVSRLKESRHGIQRYEPFLKRECGVRVGAPIPGFDTTAEDPEDWVYPEGLKLRLDVLRGLPPHGVYGFYALSQALEDAGLARDQVNDPRTGLYTASAGSPSRMYYNLDRMIRFGPQRCSPLGIVASIAGTLTFNLAAAYKIKGSTSGFVSACASSGHALGAARDEIALGRQDRILVVGAEDFSVETILPFVSMRVLSPSDDPDTASRPFDRDRDGFVGTGGAVAMILEAEEIAEARGTTPYTRFSGWGQASDGFHVAASHPDGDGLARAMQNALDATAIEPGAVGYINAHATSTPVGDISELRAIKRVFGAHQTPAVSSTKALTGHALSLSSIMESAFCNLAMRHGFLPGSAHISHLDFEAEGVDIVHESVSRRVETMMSNSSGFGGANVVLVFQQPG